MPLYDFKCQKCGEVFEALVLKNTPACPACEGVELEQLISLFRVDSPGTRDINARGQKRLAANARRDYAHDQQKAERDHHDH